MILTFLYAGGIIRRKKKKGNTDMELSQYFKSIIDEDRCAVVICNTEHIIIYMNPTACERYSKRGGAALIGKNLLDCHNEHSCEMIKKVLAWFGEDKSNNRIHTFYNEKEIKDVYMIALRDENGGLIGYYEKHEYRTRDSEPFYNMK